MLKEEVFFAAFHIFPVPAVVLLADAPKFTISEVNEEYIKVSHHSREQLVGKGFFEVFPGNPADPARTGASQLEESLLRVIRDCKSHQMDIQRYDIAVPGIDGYQEKYWRSKNTPIVGPDGSVSSILLAVEEVTAQVMAEAAGKKLQGERDLIMKVGEIFGEDNLHASLAEVLRELCIYVGSGLGEVWTTGLDAAGVNFSSRYDELDDFISHEKGMFGALAESAFQEREWKTWTVAGSRFVGIPVMNNGSVLAVLVFRSGAEWHQEMLSRNLITQIAKHIQRKKSETEFAQYFHLSKDMLCIVGYDGYFKKLNRAFTEVLGHSEEELLSQPFRSFVHPDDLDATEHTMNTIRSGKAVSRFKNRYLTRDGEIRWFEWTTTSVDRDRAMYGIARDVTAEEALEKEIGRQQRQFKAMFEEAPVSMAILKGPELIFDSANTLYYKLTGKQTLIGRRVRDVFPEVVGQGYFEKIDHTYQTGETIHEPEALIQMRNDETGELRDVYMNYMLQPYYGTEGEIEGIFYFGVDVTSQVLSRRKIEESEHRYSELIQNLPVAFFTTDKEGRIMMFNKSAIKLWGRKPAPGQEVWCESWELFRSDMSPLPREECPTMITLRTGLPVRGLDIILKQPDGTYRHIMPHPSPLLDAEGALTGVMNILIDITERKKAEEELDKLSLIARKTVNAVLITDPEGKIEWVNEAFTRLTEYTFDEAVGQTAEALLHGEGTEPKPVRRAGEAPVPFECVMLKYSKSGRPFWVEVHNQPLFDARGKLVRYFEIETDITEKRHAYDSLLRAKNETSSFARQLNSVLEDERSRISREMHDEFGQQLAGLKMSLVSLRRHSAGDPKVQQIVNSTLVDADRAIQTLRRIATDLRPGLLDTLGLFAAIEWLTTEFEKKTGIECSLSISGTSAKPDKDISICFFRVCQEALTNIMRHSGASKVRVMLTEKSGMLQLAVSDNGKGVPDSIIHNPYSMGLLGMRERANLVGGKLGIRSEPDRGTTVQLEVALPNG